MLLGFLSFKGFIALMLDFLLHLSYCYLSYSLQNLRIYAHAKIQHGIRALHVKIPIREQIIVIFLDLETFCKPK